MFAVVVVVAFAFLNGHACLLCPIDLHREYAVGLGVFFYTRNRYCMLFVYFFKFCCLCKLYTLRVTYVSSLLIIIFLFASCSLLCSCTCVGIGDYCILCIRVARIVLKGTFCWYESRFLCPS